MKILLIAVLAVLTAASTLSAQDTLKVRSYRVVDLCQNERRWLLAVDLGKILPSDSLVSFDITIGYDRTKLRPTDVLKEGTLSAGMSYEPFLNTAVPNEMRIAAGNIIKTVYGDIPLVAIAGDFLGQCNDGDTLGYPWPASFNSEFRKKFSIVTFEPVTAIVKPRVHNDQGYGFTENELTISDQENTVGFDIVSVKQGATENKQSIIITTDPRLVDVSITSANGVIIDSTRTDANVKTFFVRKTSPTARVQLVATWIGTPTQARETQILIRTESREDCSCDVSALRDTISVKKEYPNVSVSSFDEHTGIVYASNDAIHIQCDHEEMKTVVVFDALGQLVLQDLLNTSRKYISTSNLPKGIYHVRIACGHRQHVTTILK